MRSAAVIGLTLTLAAGSTAGALAAGSPPHAAKAPHKAKTAHKAQAAHKHATKRKASKRTLRAVGATLVGNASIAANVDSAPAGEAEAYPFTAQAGGTVANLSMYLDGSNRSTSVGVALYSDSYGKPNTMLTKGSTAKPVNAAWNTFSVNPVSVVSGRRYWIAVLGVGGSLAIRDKAATSTCHDVSSAQKSLTLFPSTFTTGTVWDACGVSAFASVAPATSTTTTTTSTTPTTTTTTSTTPTTTTSTTPTTTTTTSTTTTTPTTTSTTPTTTTTTSTTPTTTTTTSGACTVSASPSTFASVVSNAAAGAVVCLDSGNYGTYSGVSKSGMVTIKPAAGATPSLSITLGTGAKNLRFDGFQNFGGWDINGSQNIEIVNTQFGTPMQVRGATSGILFDNDTFDNLGHGMWEGRLSIGQSGGNVTIRNSHFGNGGCADGIQMNGGAHDILIQNNTFSGIRQGTCTEHADPIQMYGATNIQVLSNYFYNNSTGIMDADGNGSPLTAKNNVWVMDEYPYAIAGSGLTSSLIQHNVVVGPAYISLTAGNAGAGYNNTLRDNVSAFILGTGSNTVDHNLTQDKVTFRGGSGRCAYALTTTSTGHNAASDGTDIGLNDCP